MMTALRIFMRPKGQEAFLRSLPYGATILDVGCGNNAPLKAKAQRPDLFYVGIDVSDYNQATAPASVADEYIVCRPEEFAEAIAKLGPMFDAVQSTHNIEHCDDPAAVLDAIIQILKPGGQVYIAWPAEHTLHLPSRAGCLNFHDDPTHHQLPTFNFVKEALSVAGCHHVFSTRSYRPLIPALIGALLEPMAAIKKSTMPLRSTWALYGFEAVIWAKKPSSTR